MTETTTTTITTITTTTTAAPSSIIYPSDPNYPKDLILRWMSGDEDAGHELDMNYEPVMSPLYLEQFYKYYSTDGHRLYKKDPGKTFDYSMFFDSKTEEKVPNDITFEESDYDVYKVYSVNSSMFNDIINKQAEILKEPQGENWSIVYNVQNVLWSISNKDNEFLFCKKDNEDNFYGVVLDKGRYKRVKEITLKIEKEKGEGKYISSISLGPTIDTDIIPSITISGLSDNNNNFDYEEFISVKKWNLSEIRGFFDFNSQVWVKDGNNVRRTYYDTDNHCYIEIKTDDDMPFVNNFMNNPNNQKALVKTTDEFGDESFAIIPFTQWYKTGGFKAVKS